MLVKQFVRNLVKNIKVNNMKVIQICTFILCLVLCFVAGDIRYIAKTKQQRLEQSYLKETQYTDVLLHYYDIAETVIENDSVDYFTLREYNQVKQQLDSLFNTEL